MPPRHAASGHGGQTHDSQSQRGVARVGLQRQVFGTPRSLHARLAREAEQQSVSLNQWAASTGAAWLTKIESLL
jgi:hypothetical protein